MNLIAKQLANKSNFWAEEGLALLRIPTGQADASTAYEAFLALSPPAFAFRSALDGLRPLASANLATASSLQAAVELLTSRRPLAKPLST